MGSRAPDRAKRRRLGTWRVVASSGLAAALALAMPVSAQARRPPRTTASAHEPAAVPSAQDPDGAERHRGHPRGRRWLSCTQGTAPCVRPGPARLLLLSIGAMAGLASGVALFILGDRNGGGDPSTLLVGGGAVAGVGALVGIAFARLDADGPGLPDRVWRETLGLDLRFPIGARLGEQRHPAMAFRFGPTLRFAGGHGRLRLIGSVGGLLGRERDVDPRPQYVGQGDDAPGALGRRELAIDLGVDMAVGLPYPLLAPRRTAFLGPAELRFKPTVSIRREQLEVADGQRTLERTMLLPLTVGMRWHLSPRQRFTFYMGPRFDFVASSPLDSGRLQRGGMQLGPLYGEAWYDIDVPLNARRARRPPRVVVNGQLSAGYVHSRFDGHGLNFGPVVGFLGPVHVMWTTRVRPRDAKAAFQATVGARIGQGLGLYLQAGVVLPDILGRSR